MRYPKVPDESLDIYVETNKSHLMPPSMESLINLCKVIINDKIVWNVSKTSGKLNKVGPQRNQDSWFVHYFTANMTPKTSL